MPPARRPCPGSDSQEGAQRQARGAARPGLQLHRGPASQGRPGLLREALDSRTTYALALDKLGNRYFIKQQYEWAIPALRKLMEIQPDPDLDIERAEKLYDSLKAAKGRVPTQQEDIKFLVRAAVNVKVDPFKDDVTRRKQLVELEELTRDLATRSRRWPRRTTTPRPICRLRLGLQGIPLALPSREVRAGHHAQPRRCPLRRAQLPEAARQFEELEL